MPRSGLWLRVFVGLLVAVMPPILMLVGALLLTESVLREVDPDLVAILVIVGAVAWAAILAIVFERSLADDFRSLLLLAQRGDQGGDPELGTAYSQMASLLDERNRQMSTLAQQASGFADQRRAARGRRVDRVGRAPGHAGSDLALCGAVVRERRAPAARRLSRHGG